MLNKPTVDAMHVSVFACMRFVVCVCGTRYRFWRMLLIIIFLFRFIYV